MNTLIHHLRSVCLFPALLVLTVLMLADPGRGFAQAPITSKTVEPPVALWDGTADIIFPEPKRYAVVLLKARGIQRLYTNGDVLFHPHNAKRSLRLDRVDTGGILVRQNYDGQKRFFRPGPMAPDFPGVILVGTVALKQMQYRFKVVARVTNHEPVLLSVRNSQAVLEKEVLRLPARTILSPMGKPTPRTVARRTLDPKAFQKVHIQQVDKDTFEVDKETLMPVIEDIGRVISDLRINPATMGVTGTGLSMNSAVVDGILDHGGFRVTRLAVAEMFGLEVGDIIFSLNGRPVNSPLNAWWSFQELFIKNRDLKHVRVRMLRDGAVQTKTYRIR